MSHLTHVSISIKNILNLIFLIYLLIHCRLDKLQIQSKGSKIKSRLWCSYSPIYLFSCATFDNNFNLRCAAGHEISDTMAQETQKIREEVALMELHSPGGENESTKRLCVSVRDREKMSVCACVHVCVWAREQKCVGRLLSFSLWVDLGDQTLVKMNLFICLWGQWETLWSRSVRCLLVGSITDSLWCQFYKKFHRNKDRFLECADNCYIIIIKKLLFLRLLFRLWCVCWILIGMFAEY